ncbi:hypothetical protein DFJ58DRAFT_756337 [Suillus subalutaceus]|uniref:uncharacterized protein n=1 Tax=Suillus subalutaceus TaxID=48586 RepID=UPI001B87DC51|nr:uncharacterized protein DFJ58DRAFT_756337 [Suillus subalutaceus]KAG1875442.1 hypothetical protein DFJ58DRAFT_756337 [Suillus subalutaceus]
MPVASRTLAVTAAIRSTAIPWQALCCASLNHHYRLCTEAKLMVQVLQIDQPIISADIFASPNYVLNGCQYLLNIWSRWVAVIARASSSAASCA